MKEILGYWERSNIRNPFCEAFERGEAEKIEKKIVDYYNETIFDGSILNKKVLELKKKYKSKAVWTGRSYLAPGDVHIEGTDIYIESKYITKNKGTLGNISQNAMTEYELFKDCYISWQDFRELKTGSQFKQKAYSIVSKYFDIKIESQAEYEKFARLLDDDNKEKIALLARKDKKEYIDFLFKYNQNKEKIKNFYFEMMVGKNSKAQKKIEKKHLLYTFYIFKDGSDVIVEEPFNQQSNVDDNYYLSEREGTTSIYLYNGEKPQLQIAFHWKNGGQGIATPCLNIFKV